MRWDECRRAAGCAALCVASLAPAALAGCAAPWPATAPSLSTTPTPQFAGGEPVLSQLQVLYRDAPVPRGELAVSGQTWPLAGRDAANTSAAEAPIVHGTVRWFFQTPGPALAPPVVADGMALVNGGDGALYAVNIGTGDVRWRAPVGDGLVAGTPAVAGGMVYVATGSHGIAALQLATGEPLWAVNTRAPVRAPPVVAGSLLLVAAGSNALLCLDRQTGAQYWEFKSEDTFADFWPTQGQPAVTTTGGGMALVALGASTEFNALDLRSGHKLWEHSMDARMVGAPVYSARLGLVFVATWTGSLSAIDARTGIQRWRVAVPGAGTVGAGLGAGPALAGDELYLGDYQGHVMALDARTGAPLWTTQTGGALVAPPAVRMVNGVAADLYVADQQGELTALDGATGAREWQVSLGELRAAPVLAGGELLMSSLGERGLFALV